MYITSTLSLKCRKTHQSITNNKFIRYLKTNIWKKARVIISFLNVFTVKQKFWRKQYSNHANSIKTAGSKCQSVQINATEQYTTLSQNTCSQCSKEVVEAIYKLLSSAFLLLFVYCTKILKSEHLRESY